MRVIIIILIGFGLLMTLSSCNEPEVKPKEEYAGDPVSLTIEDEKATPSKGRGITIK